MEPLKVEKFATADRGNGLRAVVPLRPGELLFRCDPLAYTVCKGSRGVVCDRCLLGKEKLMRCSQCRIAKYCSAKCQKKAWPDHKQECKCLKSCKPRYPPDSVRLLARVIVKLMDEKPSESEKLYSFYDLESNINKLTEDKKEGLRQLALTFQHFTREEIQDASQLPPSFDLFEAFAKHGRVR
uniref:[histone H3]-lysine(4) N-trimethyltransferase n=1 Tax=Cricetulus griseus TaxID=10029 RepID=A0A8C2MQX3_CRIGR